MTESSLIHTMACDLADAHGRVFQFPIGCCARGDSNPAPSRLRNEWPNPMVGRIGLFVFCSLNAARIVDAVASSVKPSPNNLNSLCCGKLCLACPCIAFCGVPWRSVEAKKIAIHGCGNPLENNRKQGISRNGEDR